MRSALVSIQVGYIARISEIGKCIFRISGTVLYCRDPILAIPNYG